MQEIPFNPVTGYGLGVAYSSLNQIGKVFPQKNGLGQAGIITNINMITGNLFVSDRKVTLQTYSGPLEIGFNYNSLAPTENTCWQLNIKKLAGIPSTNPPVGQAAILQEEDGHLTTYNYGQNNGYYPQALNDGTPYLFFDSNKNLWKWYHPKTQITEYYDPKSGLLTTRVDGLGRSISFLYDVNNNLSQITDPGNNVYQIVRTNNTININEVIAGQQPKLLQSYTFDNLGRLQSTQTPSGYQTTYNYAVSGNEIYNITQTDGTNLAFIYTANNTGVLQVNRCRLGADINYSFNYPTAQNPNSATIQDGYGSTTQLTFDAMGHTTQLNQQTGYFGTPTTPPDITNYSYYPAGQLQTKTNPDGGQTTYTYNGPFGLMDQRTDPNGQVTQYNWFNDAGSNTPTSLISKTQILNGQSLTTYYVYDTNYNNSNVPFLRFTISPQGRVTEYIPTNDATAMVASIKQYIGATFNGPLSPLGPTDINEILQWVAQQNAQQISRTDFTYDTRGQVATIKRYANIDANGNGVNDAYMGFEQDTWDEFGDLLTKNILQTSTDNSITTQRFDDLQRLTAKIDALNNTTNYTYVSQNNATQIQVTYPNGREDIKTLDSSGLAASDTSIAESNNQQQTRVTSYDRDPAGRPEKTTLPDGNIVYTFYDKQNRLGYSVSPTGIVTQNTYSRVNRYKATTIYNNTIDTSKLVSPINPNILPPPCILIPLIQPDANYDRTSYEFYDASGRPIYQVDAENYVTQILYDQLNRQIGKIAYATQLTASQLQTLQAGQTLSLNYDYTQDRCVRYFYDNDNNKIGKQDGAGYVSQYIRDAAGRITNRIRYATPVTPNFSVTDFNQILPTPDANNDATTYYFRDARGQITCEVDAGGYITQHVYLPCGLKQQSTRYATPVNASWLQNPTSSPVPVTDSEDQTTTYDYDLLNRLTSADGPMGKTNNTAYDVMSNITMKQVIDAYEPEDIEPDFQRSVQNEYDEWDQVTNEANPFVAQLITAINANQNLTPLQKQQQIAAVWQNQSTRNVFDATGLKLSSTDPLGNITYYYYDQERRPIIQINPKGAVIEKTYNSFSEVAQQRNYATFLPAATLPTLTGGFITAALRAQLNGMQNNVIDQVTILQRNQRGLVTQKTDPNQNISTTTYNAYKQQVTEQLPVANQQPSLTIQHVYEARGLETQTTKTAENVATSLVTSQKYSNLYGKRTDYTDENGGLYQTIYNPVGQITEQINPLGITTNTLTNDAFNRVLTDKDSQGNVTTHVYNQLDRTHTIQYPVNGVDKTITLNVHGEKIAEEDSLGNTQSWQHAPNGKVTTYTDQLLNETIDQFDLKGHKVTHIDANQVQTSFVYNGADQLTSKTDDATGLQLETTYMPDAFGNNASVVDPKGIITSNIFDLNNNLTQSVVDPSTNSYQGLDLTTQNGVNAQNTNISKIQGDKTTPNQYEETYQQDGFNRPTGKIIDPNGLNLQIQQHLNNVGKVIADIDAKGNIKRTFYDANNQQRFIVDALGGVYERNYDTEGRLLYERSYNIAIDPTQLNDQTTLQTIISTVKTDPQDSVTYYYYDANGNECFKVNSLGIVTGKVYDLAGRLVQAIKYAVQINAASLSTYTTAQLVTLMQTNASPLDRYTYKILDAKGQDCFCIDPNKYVTQKVFDDIGRVITKIQYANPVANPQNVAQLPVDQVLAQITQDVTRDRATYQVFDSLSRPLFTVDGEGGVTAYVHDDDNNLIQTCQYKTSITVPPASYAALVTTLSALTPTQGTDRITQSKFDNGNRKIKDIDALGYSDQYFPDAIGNIETHIDRNNSTWGYQYDGAMRLELETTPSINITTVISNPLQKQRETSLIRTPLFAASNNKDKQAQEFLQKQLPKGWGVSEALAKGNSLYDCLAYYKNQIAGKKEHSIESIKSQIEDNQQSGLINLKNIAEKLGLRIHLIEIEDKKNSENDGVLMSEHRLIDANTNRIIDDEDAEQLNYNDAKLVHLVLYKGRFAALLPKTKEHLTLLSTATTTTDYIQLNSTQTQQTIQKKTFYDDNGNKTQVIDGFNTNEARAVSLSYDARNKYTGTSIINVPIDDPTQPASYIAPPVTPTTVNTQTIYNAKNQKVAEQNENGQWAFYVYDGEGRQIYTVNADCGVIQTDRNSFGEIIRETKYITPANLTLSDYTKTGIPLSVMLQQGTITTSAQDRITNYTRDNRGDVTLSQKGPVFYYLPNGNTPATGTSYTQSITTYNAFREKVSQSSLANPEQNSFNQKFTWFDRKGRKLALCDEINRVKIFSYQNAFDDLTQRIEWANQPSQAISTATTFAQLLALQDPSPQDRTYTVTYDARGQKTQETQKQVVIQSLTLAPSTNVPSFSDVPAQDLSKTYTYTNTQKLASKTYEDGSTEYHFYDARNQEIAMTNVPRQSFDSSNQPITLVPLTYYGYNSFGQQTLITRFKQGTTVQNNPNPLVPPQPIATDPDDQTQLRIYDIRGLTSFKQDAQGNVQGYTFTPTQKPARQFNQLSQIQPSNLPSIINLDEKRFIYDVKDNTIEVDLYRDAAINPQPVQMNTSKYDVFNAQIAEGDGTNWYVFFNYDVLGRCWLANFENGTWTLYLQNLQGQQTSKIVSAAPQNDAAHDLSQITYDQIASVLTWDNSILNKIDTARDAAGRMTAKILLATYQNSNDGPTNIPLEMVVGTAYPDIGATSISWVQTEETNVLPVITLWPTANVNNKQQLPYKGSNGRGGVDVSQLTTDVYGYQINYYLPDGNNQPSGNALYQTEGQLQIDTNNLQNSLSLVAVVQNLSTLKLTGNTQGVTSIDLWQNETKIANVPITQDPTNPAIYYADLSQQSSGTYTIKPIINNAEGNESLPFSICTFVPTQTPFAREIQCTVKLLMLDSHVQLIWTVPAEFANLNVQLTCAYKSNGAPQQFKGTVIPGQVIAKYYDSEGHVLYCNAEFGNSVDFVESMSLSLVVDENNTLLPLVNNVPPSSVIESNKPRPSFPVDYFLDKNKQARNPLAALLEKACIHLAMLRFYSGDAAKVKNHLRRALGNAIPVDKRDATIGKLYQELVACEFKLMSVAKKIQKLDEEASCRDVFDEVAPRLMEQGEVDTNILLPFNIAKDHWATGEIRIKRDRNTQLYKIEITAPDAPNATQMSDENFKILSATIQKKIKSLDKKALFTFQNMTGQLSHKREINKVGLFGEIIINYFSPTNTLYISPLQNPNNDTYVNYFDVTKDRFASWVQLLITGTVTPSSGSNLQAGITVDGTKLAPANYPFKLDQQTGTFSVTGGSMVYDSAAPSPQNNLKAVPLPVAQYSYIRDNWDNIVSEQDAAGNTTLSAYSARDQLLTQTLPTVTISNADGTQVQGNPQTSYGYDIRNMQIGMRDPNTNTQGVVRDAAGQITANIMADGTTSYSRFDALGRKPITIDASNNTWTSSFDHNNLLTTFTSPLNNSHQFIYDEKKHRVGHVLPGNSTLPNGRPYLYNFDVTDDVSKNYYPSTKWFSYIADRNHQWLSITNSDGDSLTWQRNFFGIATNHIDLGGATYLYIYDQRFQKLQETCSGGNHGSTLTGMKMQLPYNFIINNPNIYAPSFQEKAPSYSFPFETVALTESGPTPGKNITYQYQNGYLMQINDITQQTICNYSLNINGRNVGVIVQGYDGTILRDCTNQLDAVNREVMIYDTKMLINIGYDAASNRRFVDASFYEWEKDQYGVYHPVIINQQNWFSYTVTNNAINSQCVLKNGEIQLAPGQGVQYGYANGLRTSELQLLSNGTQFSGALTYTTEGLLWTVKTSDGYSTTRSYYPDGWLQETTQTGAAGTIQHSFIYDDDGNDLHEITYQNSQKMSEVYYYNSNDPTNPQYPTIYGLPLYSIASNYDTSTSSWIIDTLDSYIYVGFDSWQQASVGGSRNDKYGTGAWSQALQYFDANGLPIGKSFVSGVGTYYFNSPDGSLLGSINCAIFPQSSFGPSAPFTFVPKYTTVDYVQSRFFYTASGELLASYASPSEALPYINPDNSGVAIDLGYIQPVSQTHPLVSPQTTFTNAINKLPLPSSFKSLADAVIKDSFPTLQEAVLDAFNDSYPPPAPSNYTPVLGDTFSTIAALFSQNSAYASTIAMMNGLNAGDVPQPGEQIFIPQFLSNYNNYATLPPSGQIISKLYGSLYPVLQTIQPPVRNHKHSFWGGFFGGIGEIFLAIVAVVVSAYIPGLGFAIAGALFGGSLIAEVVIDSVLLVMAGLAQEELTVQMGLAAHFSLGQALLDAFEDNESGIGEIASAGITIEELGLMVLAVGVANIEEQFLAMDLGLQKGFSLRAVASAITTQLAIEGLDLLFGISSAITIGETAGKALENDLEQEAVTVGVQTLVDKEIAHQAFNLQFTIEDAIGTVAGEFMVQEAEIYAMQQYQQAQQAAQNASQQQSAATAMSKYGMYRSNAAQSGGAASSAYGSGNTISTSSVDDSNSTTFDSGQPVDSNAPLNLSPVPLIFKPGLTAVGQGPEGYELYDSSTGQYFTYNTQSGLSSAGDLGVAVPAIPEAYVAGTASLAVTTVDLAALGGAYLLKNLWLFADNTATFNLLNSMAADAGDVNFVVDSYHATSTAGAAQSVLNGIDPIYFGASSRFGQAFYVALDPDTAIAEATTSQTVVAYGIRYNLDVANANILDLTDPEIAAQYGYDASMPPEITQKVSQAALNQNFDAIMYNSVQTADGINFAILRNFNELLTPQGVSPIIRMGGMQ